MDASLEVFPSTLSLRSYEAIEADGERSPSSKPQKSEGERERESRRVERARGSDGGEREKKSVVSHSEQTYTPAVERIRHT